MVVLGAGGIWLVRNWVRFGSPTAPTGLTLFGMTIWSGDPWAPTTYLSVLGDRTSDPSYPWIGRTLFFARQWLGRWYAPVSPKHSYGSSEMVTCGPILRRSRRRGAQPCGSSGPWATQRKRRC